MKFYFNGRMVKGASLVDDIDMDEEETTSINAPGYIVIEEKAVDEWTGDFSDTEAEDLGKLLRMDTEQYCNKRMRLFIQVLGKAERS